MRAGSTLLSIVLMAGVADAATRARDAGPPLPATLALPALQPIPAPEGLADFRIEVDPVSGRPARAMGGRLPWIAGLGNVLPGSAPEGEQRRAVLLESAERFVAAYPELWRLPATALRRDLEGTVSVASEELDVVRLALVDEGLPVRGAGLVFVLRFGNLVYFGSSHASAPGEARWQRGRAAMPLARERARELLATALGVPVASLGPAPEPRLGQFVLPGLAAGVALRRRVIALRFRPEGELIDLEGWLDQDSGEIVALFPAERSCSGTGAGATARVSGGVRPARATDPEEERLLPWVDLSSGGFSSKMGTFAFDGSEVSSTLRGRYAAINCLACSNPPQANASSDVSGRIAFGVNLGVDQDSAGNGTSTISSRTAYAHVNTARELASKWLGGSLAFLDRALEVQVNGQNSCNAFWSGFALRFFESAADCRNTGEIRDVIVHEWGHALDDFDGNAISDGALSEGAADVLATFFDRNACIGDSIWTDPALGASARCTGVRDLDERSLGSQHSPALLTWSQNDCQGGVHCLGEIYGQTAWHLVANLRTGRSYADASALGAAYGDEMAWEIAERLYMLSRPLAETLDPAGAGLSLYDAYVLADLDPVGNHPHLAHINEAFAHHELIEDPPADGGFPCAAPPDPEILLSRVSRGTDGEPEVALWWKDTTASSYRVLRRRVGAELAWMPVTAAPIKDDGRPQYGLLDTSLENGRSYQYLILAESVPGCSSPGAAQLSISIALPELHLAGHQESDPRPGGDGDGILEPGEFVELGIELEEILGAAAATGVSATLSSLDPLVRVGLPDRLDLGDIPALGARAPATPFIIYLDSLHRCPATIPLVLRLDSDEGCVDRALAVEITAAACAASQRSDVRFLSAAVVSDSINPSCSDHDLVMDAGEEVRLLVSFENQGMAAASEVEVVLSTPEANLSFVSGSRATYAPGLAPGASAAIAFDLLAGDLGCGQRIPFQAEVRAPENLQPSAASFELQTEEDVAYRALTWDFESGAQGWTGDGAWSLSRSRANPSDSGQSFWSGAAFNLCSSLISPEIRLGTATAPVLGLASWYELEGRFQAKYWDGVNVYVKSASGDVLLTPFGGRGYDAALSKLVSCETSQPAWCSDTAGRSWATSSFDLAPWAGQTVRIVVRYATDNKTNREGFYVDDVSVADVALTTCDANLCAPDPSCSAPEMQLAVLEGGCAGDPVTLAAHFDYLGTGSFRYLWDFGDGEEQVTTVPDAPVAHVYKVPGSYVARLTAARVLDPLCSATATVAVSVGAPPIADAGPEVNAPAIIGTPGFTGISYQWSPVAGLDDPTLAMPRAFPAATTQYCVEARDLVRDCLRTDCVLVKVPLFCGLDPDAARDLGLARAAGGVEASWSAIPGADHYDFYRVAAKHEIPAAKAVNTTAELIERSSDNRAVDASGLSAPPRLWFYQAIVRCP